jgi:hypothetical protein
MNACCHVWKFRLRTVRPQLLEQGQGQFQSQGRISCAAVGVSSRDSLSIPPQALAPTVSSKQCDRCLVEKAPSEFVADKYSPDGLKKRCKLCMVRPALTGALYGFCLSRMIRRQASSA